jgi:hypothetical protein
MVFADGRRLQITITMPFLIKLYDQQEGKCAISGRPLSLGAEVLNGFDPNTISLDRKDPNKGYSMDNVQLTTLQVNIAKGRSTDEEFIKMCEDVVANKNQKASPVSE